MKYLLCAAAIAAVSAPACAENWRTVSENDQFPGSITYLDTDSIVRTGDNVEYTIWEFQEDATDGYVGDNFVQKRSVSCSGKSFVIFSDQSYIGTTPQGEPTQLITRKVAEGGADLRSLEAACGTGSYLSEKISDPAFDADDYFYYLEGW